MTTKQQKVRIGLFVVIAGLLVGIVLISFAGVHFWKPRTKYKIVFDHTVYGLEPGADVYVNGIRSGKVTDIRLAPEDLRHVQVTIAVKQGTPIRTDTKAVLQFAGLTGLKVVDLRGGSWEAPKLPPGGTIAVGETILDKMETRAMAMVDETDQILKNANNVVKSAQQVVDNVNELTDPKALGDVIAQSRQAAANLAQLSQAMRGLVEDNRASLRASVASIETATKQFATMIDGNQVKAAVSDLRQASRSMKEMARDVRNRPSRLLFSKPEPDRKLP
ncbi:MAG TPA: MlaD family protein [Kofleriaceae bacterium]|jgi:phospholipid/cholesterol/gamma-HCH transport system substrate-binding protein|nr:MlaD family protein [Kofleriaceae bacterium]